VGSTAICAASQERVISGARVLATYLSQHTLVTFLFTSVVGILVVNDRTITPQNCQSPTAPNYHDYIEQL